MNTAPRFALRPSSNAPWIKVCGLRTVAEVECAAAAGATHAGFNTWPQSPRHTDPQTLPHLLAAAASIGLIPVLLLVPGSLLTEEQALGHTAWFQSATPLHSSQRDGRLLVEARPAHADTIAEATWGDALLLDAYLPGKPGGTGLPVDRDLALRAPRPFVLAGGLTPENVAEAISAVSPAGVDAASGLESGPGVKDPGRVRAFCQAAREAFSRLSQSGATHAL